MRRACWTCGLGIESKTHTHTHTHTHGLSRVTTGRGREGRKKGGKRGRTRRWKKMRNELSSCVDWHFVLLALNKEEKTQEHKGIHLLLFTS